MTDQGPAPPEGFEIGHWTDAEGRPLKFASARTMGLREGYEDLASLAPAGRDQVFPPTAAR